MYTPANNTTNQIGNLVADPQLRELPSGTSVCELRLAVDGAGNKKDDTGYFDVAIYGKAGEAAHRHLAQGSLVAAHGRLQHRTWTTAEGAHRSTVRIVGNVKFLDRRTPADETAAREIDDAVPVGAVADGEDIPF